MDNRIEGAKKVCPRCKGTGKIIWHNKQAGREFEGLDYEVSCPDCQLFPQLLDDKELREKALLTRSEINDVVLDELSVLPTPNTAVKAGAKAQLEKDFALLQPKIEEVKEYYEHKCKHCQYMYFPNVVKEAKRGEIGLIEINEQALKGGE